VSRGHRVLKEKRASKENKDSLEKEEIKATEETRGSRDQKVNLGLPVKEVRLDLAALIVIRKFYSIKHIIKFRIA
jgi:hypothetical protein